LGEFAGVCQYCHELNNETPYQTILEECHKNAIGWIAWEWGPGNEKARNNPCYAMNMTTDGTYAAIRPGWPNEVAITHPYSIKNTARTPWSFYFYTCYCDDFQIPRGLLRLYFFRQWLERLGRRLLTSR